MNESYPKQIAHTIGMKEPPPTEELMKGPFCFEKKLKWALEQHATSF